MSVFHLYTPARGRARLGEAHVNWVHLVLDGPGRTGLVIILPTCDPDDLDPEFFEGWLATIQGPVLTAVEADDDQRAFLLRVVLTYRAFATHHPGVNITQYLEFTTMFVLSALALQSDDDAAPDLNEIDDWMTNNIPLEILEPRNLPPRTDEESSTPPVAWRFPGHRVITTDGWTSPALDPATRGETIHVLSTGIVPSPSSAVTEGQKLTSRGAPAGRNASSSARTQTARSIARAHVNGADETATLADEDAGNDSDSSMPGLKTPSDGSDVE